MRCEAFDEEPVPRLPHPEVTRPRIIRARVQTHPDVGQGERNDDSVWLELPHVQVEMGPSRRPGIADHAEHTTPLHQGIDPDPEMPGPGDRPSPLLLYDLWNDPMALWSLHEERPDLVQKYTVFLEEQFEAHLALGQYFTPSGEVELTPEQLQTLRSLGYIN